MFRNFFALLCASLLVSGCFSPKSDLPHGDQAYAIIPPANPSSPQPTYRIGVLDELSIRVFQEPELSFDKISVDASGTLNYPLIGQIQAEGKTPIQLSDEIEKGLGARFIRNPQVVVGVLSSAAQRVTVEGSVIEPGVYEVAGASSLVEAIARAKGLTEQAVDDEVIVFREVDGQREGAVFNYRDIREGRAADPQILGGDRIVVGFSALKGVYRDILKAAPLFNVFTRF